MMMLTNITNCVEVCVIYLLTTTKIKNEKINRCKIGGAVGILE